jgi:hypothetical protein
MLIALVNRGRLRSLRTVASLVLATVVLSAGCASDQARPSAVADLRRAEAAYYREDFATAAKLLAPLALRGDREAQYALGYLYYYGQGVPRDRTRALRWFQDASQQGHRKARQALELVTEQARLSQVPPGAEHVAREEVTHDRPGATPPSEPVRPSPVKAAVREAPASHAARPVEVKFGDTAASSVQPVLLPIQRTETPPLAVVAEKARRPQGGYTLQLLGSRSRQDLVELVRRNGLDAARAYHLRGEHKGGPWYRLLYGRYSSPAAAKAALKALPEPVKSKQPWVRPLPALAAKVMQ